MALLKNVWPNHHTVISLSVKVKRWSKDISSTGRIVIDWRILDLRSGSRIF